MTDKIMDLEERLALKESLQNKQDKKHGEHIVRNAIFPKTKVSTGIYTLDREIGGFSFSYFYEIAGKESSGKSSLVQRALGSVNRINHETGLFDDSYTNPCGVAYVDAERTFDPDWAIKLDFPYDLPVNTIEYIGGGDIIGDTVLDYINSNLYSAIVIDSAESMFPVSVLEGDMSTNEQGLRAKILYRCLRKWNNALAVSCRRNRGSLWRVPFIILINHSQLKMMTIYPEYITPGGGGPKYYAGMRIQLNRKKIKNDTTSEFGLMSMTGEVIKSKLGSDVGSTFSYDMAIKDTDNLAMGEIDNVKELMKDIDKYEIMERLKAGKVSVFGEEFKNQKALKEKMYAEPDFQEKVWKEAIKIGRGV
jgi:RecA/RadA recombinase